MLKIIAAVAFAATLSACGEKYHTLAELEKNPELANEFMLECMMMGRVSCKDTRPKQFAEVMAYMKKRDAEQRKKAEDLRALKKKNNQMYLESAKKARMPIIGRPNTSEKR